MMQLEGTIQGSLYGDRTVERSLNNLQWFQGESRSVQSGSTLGTSGTCRIIELHLIGGRSHTSGFFKDLQQNTLHTQVKLNSGNHQVKDLQAQLASLQHRQSLVSAGDSTSTPPLNHINGEEAPTKTKPPGTPTRLEETTTNAAPTSSTASHNQ